MPDNDPTNLPNTPGGDAQSEDTSRERTALLHSIFMGQARAIQQILACTPPEKLRASMIQAITQWCRLQGLSSDTLPDPYADARTQGALSQKIKSLSPEGGEDPARAEGGEDSSPLKGYARYQGDESPNKDGDF